MKTFTYDIEGLKLQIEQADEDSKESRKNRFFAYVIKELRASTGMPITVFCNWLGIPLRTMEQWERGDRVMPEYVLRLIAYKVRMEKKLGNI